MEWKSDGKRRTHANTHKMKMANIAWNTVEEEKTDINLLRAGKGKKIDLEYASAPVSHS